MRRENNICQKNLVAYRLRHNLTQEDMAKRLGIKSQQMYEYYENKRLVDGKALKFSEILNVNLFEGSPKNSFIGSAFAEVKADEEKVDYKRIEATLKVLIHRLAKYESKVSDKPIMDCKKEIEEDILLVLG